ncbi:hypothetical protein CEQ90_08200 [Lewinellaceae bacterium SD302]|nr:hypothetical protein CEQ90_08200 [Lewinellaceae bacterium SD302]
MLLCACNQASLTQEEATTTEPDSLIFTTISLEDSILLIDGMTDGPMSRYQIDAKVLASGPSELQRMVNDSLLAAYGFAGEVPNGDYRAAYRSLIDTTFAVYRNHDLQPEDVEYPVSFMETNEFSTEVLINKPGLLVLSRNFYFFGGGAHGIYGTSYLNFTTQPAKSLSLDDVFTKSDTMTLGPLLMEHLEDKERLYTDEEPVPPTQNFCLTELGVIFCYPPYEIGPYAAGQIEIFIPHEVLKERALLRPEIETLVGSL